MASAKTAIVIGMGDGRATRLLEQRRLGFERFITIRLPGEALVPVPGLVFDASANLPNDLVREGWREHVKLIALADAEFFDRHPIAVDDQIRVDFATQFYRLLCDKPLDFGDDVLDGMQGAFHLAYNAKHLLSAPLPMEFAPGGRFTCPAISVASGPSLSRQLPAIRALQDKALIFCSDSSVDGLIAADIVPHFVTPVERCPEIRMAFKGTAYPGITYAGKHVVCSDILDKFSSFISAPCTDSLYAWAGYEQSQMHYYGQSTGVMSMSLACQMTSGPVYLAGHDLAMAGDATHWSSAQAMPVDRSHMYAVPGNHGTVLTEPSWDAFRRQIATQARMHGGVVNLNTLDGIGAVIPYTLSGSLPQPADLPDLVFPEHPEPNHRRIVAFRETLERLPKDIAGALTKLSSRRLRVEELALEQLCPSPNRHMLSYLLRSVYAQFSYETYFEKKATDVVTGLADAIRGVLAECRSMFEDMARAAHA